MGKPSASARELREAAAADWAAAIDAGPLDETRQSQLDAWLNDTRNRGALLRAQAALRVLNASSGAVRPPISWWRRQRATFLALGTGIAAALAILLVWPSPTLDTEIGEIRQMPLADGSNTVLDTSTQIRPAFDTAARDIDLRAGRALFRVAHDADRPFVVTAQGIHVRAVGTMFSVAHEPGGITVLVAEGVVAVTGDGHVTTLRADQRGRFRVGSRPQVEHLSDEDMTRALSWREGRLELNGQTLASAVAAINRYNSRPIHILDSSLAAEPLYGGFRTDDPEGFARVAAMSLGARWRPERDKIVISR